MDFLQVTLLYQYLRVFIQAKARITPRSEYLGT